MTDQPNLYLVDWDSLPVPEDDGAAAHLTGMALPSVALAVTGGGAVDPSYLEGRTVIFIYPAMGEPGKDMPDGWDDIPGARGCTPQACSFRDMMAELTEAGADRVFGLSSQSAAVQQAAADRLHLPYPLLCDEDGALRDALNLPTFEAAGERLLSRMILILQDNVISQVFYPVFPPDQSADIAVKALKAAG